MNPSVFLPPGLRRAGLALLLASLAAVAGAAPGAHGPNGEHLDAPPAGATAAAASPRLEAQSERFELVAHLQGGELSLLIDHHASNEPLLQASVEVESGGLKALAPFHADLGDYAVDDPALLKLLSSPGEHVLLITVRAGDQADLLEGMLQVGPGPLPAAAHGHGPHGPGDGHGPVHGHDHDPAHDHGHGPALGGWRAAVAGLAVLALGLGLGLGWAWRGRRASAARKPEGELA